MKTAEYLASLNESWQPYNAPGDSVRLKKFVAKKWKTSPFLEHYADTYLPVSEVDMGPFILLSAEDIESNQVWEAEEQLLSKLGLLQIAQTVGSEHLFMRVDTGQVFFIDVSEIPVSDFREMECNSTDINEFDVDEWVRFLKELAMDYEDGDLSDIRVFESFEQFDEACLAWIKSEEEE